MVKIFGNVHFQVRTIYLAYFRFFRKCSDLHPDFITMLLIDILTDLVADELVFDLSRQNFFLGDLLSDLYGIFSNTGKPLFKFGADGGLYIFFLATVCIRIG